MEVGLGRCCSTSTAARCSSSRCSRSWRWLSLRCCCWRSRADPGPAEHRTEEQTTMQNFYAFLELMGMLVTDPRTGVLIGLLVVAAISDWRTYRIPNWLTGGGLVFGLVCNTW